MRKTLVARKNMLFSQFSPNLSVTTLLLWLHTPSGAEYFKILYTKFFLNPRKNFVQKMFKNMYSVYFYTESNKYGIEKSQPRPANTGKKGTFLLIYLSLWNNCCIQGISKTGLKSWFEPNLDTENGHWNVKFCQNLDIFSTHLAFWRK